MPTPGASSRCQSSPPSGKLRRMRLDRLPISVLRTRYVPGGWDLLAFVLVFAFFVYAAQAARGLAGSLAHLEAVPISLAPSALVGYSARTALRMLIAMSASLVFTFTYATLAAKSRRAEVLLVPLLDFLQSVPILSFSITLLFFLQLTPGRVAGAEMAAIFLIFTSQAWNMAFSFYHSLRSIPDQPLFRPLTASADWFRLDQEVGLTPSHSWALTMMRRSHFLGLLARAFAALLRAGMRPGATAPAALERRASVWDAGWVDYAWYALLALIGLVALSKTAGFVLGEVRPAEIGQVVILGLITLRSEERRVGKECRSRWAPCQ